MMAVGVAVAVATGGGSRPPPESEGLLAPTPAPTLPPSPPEEEVKGVSSRPQSASEDLLSPTPGPTVTMPLPEEVVKWRLRGSVFPRGPYSVGSRVSLGNRSIQLPNDVYVDAVVNSGLCVVGQPCSQGRVYVLRHGESVVTVEERTGRILYEQLATGDEGAFDFLRQALE